jgi:biopolymer transport protein ExbD
MWPAETRTDSARTGIMARFRHSSGDDGDEMGIDISPLIDCVFILLIFFIVTTAFVEERGFAVDKPRPASEPSTLDKTIVVIRLSASGHVFHKGHEISPGAVREIVKAVLRREDAPVVIQAEAGSRSAMLVRLIDEARLAGATKVNLTSINPRS